MPYPLKNLIYEIVQQRGNITDVDLLKELAKNGEITMSALNKALFHLEILGLISVRWMGKDKRRIEVVVQSQEDKTMTGEPAA